MILLYVVQFSSLTSAEDWQYTVRPGDTLWTISQTYLQNVNYWSSLQQYNQVTNPKYLPPGLRLNIPIAWLKQPPKPAQITAFSGQVNITLPNSTSPQLITQPIKLPAGSIIQTTKNAHVMLKFADGSTLLVQEQTTLHLDSISLHSNSAMVDTRMRLQRGRIETQVIPFTHPDSRFEITTPAAVTAVRGTQFRVAMDAIEATMRSEVLKGQVSTKAQNTEYTVNAGFGITTQTGQPPSSPQRLAPAPDLNHLAPYFNTSTPVHFQWAQVDNAINYRTQLFQQTLHQIPETTKFIREIKTPTAQIHWTDLPVGNYRMTVRAIDKFELEGISAEHAFSLFAALTKPTLESPKNKATLSIEQLTFHWIITNNAPYYRLQIATDNNFSDQQFDKIIDTQYLTLSTKLAPGQYYWRVASRHTNTMASDDTWSQSFQFLLQPPPKQ